MKNIDMNELKMRELVVINQIRHTFLFFSPGIDYTRV